MQMLRSAVHEAAGREEVRDAVEGVYRDLAAKVEERRPLCIVSGRCCRFEEYGHRLYVTSGSSADPDLAGIYVATRGHVPGGQNAVLASVGNGE